MVDAELFERYRKALDAVATLAKSATEDLVSKMAGLEPKQQAALLLSRYPELVRRYGKLAAEVAREYYQMSRDEWDPDEGYAAQQAHEVEFGWAAEDVSKAARDGVDILPGISVRRCYQRADETISYNASRDPAHPRWALVPHPGACGWCVMVSSNGWAYSERGVNAQRHDNCRCAVAVDFDRDDPSLAGYDVDALRAQYRQGVEDAGDTWAKWQALTPEERESYRRKGRSAYDVFKAKLIAQAMDERMGNAHEGH